MNKQTTMKLTGETRTVEFGKRRKTVNKLDLRQGQRLMNLLDKVCLKDTPEPGKAEYKKSWDDERVATQLGIAVSSVQYHRSKEFGTIPRKRRTLADAKESSFEEARKAFHILITGISLEDANAIEFRRRALAAIEAYANPYQS